MSKGGGVNIPSNYTIKLGSDGSTIHIDSDLDNIHVKEIAPVTVNSNLAVTQPIVTDATSKSDSTANVDLKIEPLTVDSDSKSEIDLKPVVVDSCQTIKLAPLPPIRVEQPYSQHFGFTYMGMELFGFTMSGKSEVFLHSPQKSHAYAPRIAEAEETRGTVTPKAADVRPGGGLRVRVNDDR